MAPKFIRKLKRWKVTNPQLLELMVEHGVGVGDMAELTDVSIRSVEKWVYEGATPRRKKQAVISDLFGLPARSIFI